MAERWLVGVQSQRRRVRILWMGMAENKEDAVAKAKEQDHTIAWTNSWRIEATPVNQTGMCAHLTRRKKKRWWEA